MKGTTHTIALKQARQAISGTIGQMVVSENLLATYTEQAPYQQNSSKWWGNSAKRETAHRVPDEFKPAGRYINLKWKPR